MTVESTERSYAAFVVRHLRLLATSVLIGILGAAVFLVWRPTSYVAGTQVTLTAYAVAPGMDLDRPTWISPDSDAQVLSSLPVLTRAVERTGFPGGADALSERLAVSAVPNSRILVARVRDTDADRAVATAAAVVNEFLILRGEAAVVRAETARSTLSRQITAVSEELASLRSTMLAGNLLTDNQRVLEQQLSNRLDALQADVVRAARTAQDPGYVVVPAAIAPTAGPPIELSVLVSGGLLGGVVGLGLSALADQRRAARRRSPGWSG